ncbi:putative glucan endo-1,3-beta-glucosidase eglC [Fulvia fulva]|uniref:Probable glucan endo-1,3-beta-glucosidase eglC n=1 Tax=Passalora fulva TaxID=5499 RepID=A0A9Q8LAS8_PASFU|nr:putative glucan endo-1,3-beta-glucosidase eglC [Fulvia fulva]UJO13947.1 putative glucan endo-1,3-beta-glucosidase eglC [Fulvia fulva]WPV11046.1 putative glucan endo-1,3-beta-glucosidase eglC [Fulvia fulva]
MHTLHHLLTLAACVQAAIRGFNSGGTGPNGIKHAADFRKEFDRIRTLPGTDPFTSIRLFSTIQAGTVNDPVEAFQPAIDTKYTTLLLGLWASAGQEAFNNELAALKKAIAAHQTHWKDIVVGISVGSEDLYRITPTGIGNKENVGVGPGVIVDYIKQTRAAIKGTVAEGTKVGHVDTWTAWISGSNTAVIDAVDFLGFDGYPYYEKDTGRNSIKNAQQLFFESYNKTVAVSKGKEVWITETGWPVSGPQDFGKSVASIPNAKKYWDDVGCRVFGNINTWWFRLDDAKQDPKEVSFSTIKPNHGEPLFSLTCPK